MLRFLADENFHNHIVSGLRKRRPELDVVRVQDVGLRRADDPTILNWAAEQGRVLLTHDAATIPDHAYDRVAAGLPMPGVLEIHRGLPIGRAIELLLDLATASASDALEGQVRCLPSSS